SDRPVRLYLSMLMATAPEGKKISPTKTDRNKIK
ncbi:MAG: hypothetical protein ACI8P2_004615, partial [Candidatus Latescibacterota bacterium]